VITNGVLPAGLIGGGLWVVGRWLRRQRRATRNEVILAGMTLLAVAFMVLTTVGVWFRGPGMTLTWPWQR
jgi:hypothetical protein